MISNFIKRECCPVCSTNSFDIIYKSSYNNNEIRNYLFKFYAPQGQIDYSYFIDTPYILCECPECSLIFQQYVPNEELAHLLYDKWIDPETNYQYHSKMDGLGLYSEYAIEMMRIISTLNKTPSELSFLDFGMGWGKWIMMAKAFGINAYGIEFASAKKMNADKLGITLLEIDHLPGQQFDFINTEQVFEHLENPMEILSLLTNSLRKGGIIKISVPNGNNFKKKFVNMDWRKSRFEKNSFHVVSPIEHINLFTTKSLNILAKNNRLKPFFIPIKKQIKYSINMKPFYPLLNNILQPLKRNILKKETYCFFIKN